MIDRSIIESAIEIADNIFKVKVPVRTTRQGQLIGPARYNFINDSVELIQTFIEEYHCKFDSKEKLITHAICHEFGHAKESRYFAEGEIFPFYLKISKTSSIKAPPVLANLYDLSEALGYVMNGLLDYSIDDKLKNYRIKNIAAKYKIDLMKKFLISKKDGKKNSKEEKLRATFNLPIDIGYYDLAELTNCEREVIIEYHEFVGIYEKWDTVRHILKSKIFAETKEFLDTVQNLYSELLGIQVKKNLHYKKEFQKKFGKLPEFWKKDAYHIFYLD